MIESTHHYPPIQTSHHGRRLLHWSQSRQWLLAMRAHWEVGIDPSEPNSWGKAFLLSTLRFIRMVGSAPKLGTRGFKRLSISSCMTCWTIAMVVFSSWLVGAWSNLSHDRSSWMSSVGFVLFCFRVCDFLKLLWVVVIDKVNQSRAAFRLESLPRNCSCFQLSECSPSSSGGWKVDAPRSYLNAVAQSTSHSVGTGHFNHTASSFDANSRLIPLDRNSSS